MTGVNFSVANFLGDEYIDSYKYFITVSDDDTQRDFLFWNNDIGGAA